MTARAIYFKMDEFEINDMKHVASIYHMTITDLIREAVSEYLIKMKSDPFYRLTACVEDADEEETAEILDVINNLDDDDLTITSRKSFSA